MPDTRPEARLTRKGKGTAAKLALMGHALMENRNGMLMDDARQRGFRPKTLAGDSGYDTRECVKAMRDRGVTPHGAQRVHSAIDGRTTRHPGYGVSQRNRKLIAEEFGMVAG